MAWPATRTTLAKAFAQGDLSMLAVKSTAEQLSTDSAGGPVTRRRVLNLMRDLNALDALLTATIAYGADAVSYARSEYREPGLDVAAEYTAVRDAARDLATWIDGAMADGTELTEKSGNTFVDTTYTTAQLATMRTNITTFAATIA